MQWHHHALCSAAVKFAIDHHHAVASTVSLLIALAIPDSVLVEWQAANFPLAPQDC